MRYIAAQGPKDAKVSTIADFFRMAVEQNITVIIMAANFVENGKVCWTYNKHFSTVMSIKSTTV